MSTSLAVLSNETGINVQRVKDQRDAIQMLLKEVLVEGIDRDYAVIPGTKKKTLLKPGAEKICSMFGLAVEPSVEAIRDGDDVTFRVTCRLTSGGVFIGDGIGEASTLESKFAWREAVCQEEWDETAPHLHRRHWKKGHQGANPIVVLQVRENPADKMNNMLKIAKKRAMIDAVLTATAASDTFTQDLEPLLDKNAGKSSAPVSGKQVEAARGGAELISSDESKAFFKAWKGKNRDPETVKQYMKIHCGGITDDRRMERQYYAEALRWAGTNEPIPEVKKRAPAPTTIDQAQPKPDSDPTMKNIKAAFDILGTDLAEQAALFGEYRDRLPELEVELKSRVDSQLADE